MNNKREVRDFYDRFGWLKLEGELFTDARLFEDLRPVSRDYIHKCHLRVNRYIKPRGKYLLDAASGPIQYAEYFTYSDGFNTRICIDISLLSLEEARRRLGDKGAYILADITNLPFKNDSIDAILSLHTIYHVPAEEQETAFREIYRVLRFGGSAVVVYSWGGHSFLMNLALYPIRPIQMLKAYVSRLSNMRRRAITQTTSKDHQFKLYFHAHDYSYFAKQPWNFDYHILVWRSVSVEFTRIYIHKWLIGRQFLSVVYWLEDKFTHAAGRLGQYPLFLIVK